MAARHQASSKHDIEQGISNNARKTRSISAKRHHGSIEIISKRSKNQAAGGMNGIGADQ